MSDSIVCHDETIQFVFDAVKQFHPNCGTPDIDRIKRNVDTAIEDTNAMMRVTCAWDNPRWCHEVGMCALGLYTCQCCGQNVGKSLDAARKRVSDSRSHMAWFYHYFFDGPPTPPADALRTVRDRFAVDCVYEPFNGGVWGVKDILDGLWGIAYAARHCGHLATDAWSWKRNDFFFAPIPRTIRIGLDETSVLDAFYSGADLI